MMWKSIRPQKDRFELTERGLIMMNEMNYAAMEIADEEMANVAGGWPAKGIGSDGKVHYYMSKSKADAHTVANYNKSFEKQVEYFKKYNDAKKNNDQKKMNKYINKNKKLVASVSRVFNRVSRKDATLPHIVVTEDRKFNMMYPA